VVTLTSREPGNLTLIRPSTGWQPLRLRELWEYRDLLWFLTIREVQIRYKQTLLGAAWAIIQPLMTMVVFTIFFGRLGNLQARAPETPYPVLVFSGLLPWQLFSYALANASNSLVTKVYFPRLIIPLSATLSGLVDFAVTFVLLCGLMVAYHVPPSVNLLLLPVFLLLTIVAALAVGLWMSALNVRYRDIRYTIPFVTQFWLFLTPVAYPGTLIEGRWRFLYALNPMVGAVEGFRWSVLGRSAAPAGAIVLSAAITLAVLVGGLFYFRRMERSFADVV